MELPSDPVSAEKCAVYAPLTNQLGFGRAENYAARDAVFKLYFPEIPGGQ
jgi:hypothetical protein